MPLSLEEACGLLHDKASAKRRQAAKRLRALADPVAAPSIRTALTSEVRDPRTWETQYQMVMALGMTGNPSDVPVLQALATQERAATMVNVAIGDALVRLGSRGPGESTTLNWCLDQPVSSLDDGALRAVAVLRLPVGEPTVSRILAHVEAEPQNSGLRFWPAVAAVDWTGEPVTRFLRACAAGPRRDVAEAAARSLRGEFYKPRVL